MSGAWAREADAMALSDRLTLKNACQGLLYVMEGDHHPKWWLLYTSAIIRRERKRLGESQREEVTEPYASEATDQALILGALNHLTTAMGHDEGYPDLPVSKAHALRIAEAFLRTLHKRGRA
jgi:hypothetical protein